LLNLIAKILCSCIGELKNYEAGLGGPFFGPKKRIGQVEEVLFREIDFLQREDMRQVHDARF
jgi:hypothetical protein